jgi:hypothetical protein
MSNGVISRRQRPAKGGRPAPVHLSVEALESRALLSITLSPGPNVLVNPRPGNQSETAVAINPTNSLNLFATSNDPTLPRLAGYYSFDGGTTWSTSVTTNIPNSCCDAQTAWDGFGNLFVTYINLNGNAVVTVMSIDGGVHFSLIDTAPGNLDQPSIAVGPSGFGDGSGSVWISYNNVSANRVQAKGALVTDVGVVGAFTGPVNTITGSFGGTAVGPNGQVMVAVENPYGSTGPANLLVSVNPNGLAGPVFGPAQLVASTNVGGFTGIPAQPRRSVDAEFNIAYDNSGGPTTGRVYAVYTDRPTTTSAATDIYVTYSDSDGAVGTWGAAALVNDDFSGNSHFNPAIAIDQSVGTPTSGFVALSWYDARNSPANNSAEVWGTVLDGSTDPGTGQLIVQPTVPISTGGLINAHASDPSFEFGDYDLMDFNNGTFYRTWADNTLPGHNSLDLATAPVTVTVAFPSPNPGPHKRLGAGILVNDIPAGDVFAALTLVSNGAGTQTTALSLPPLSGGNAVALTSGLIDQLFTTVSGVGDGRSLDRWGDPLVASDATEDLGLKSTAEDGLDFLL